MTHRDSVISVLLVFGIGLGDAETAVAQLPHVEKASQAFSDKLEPLARSPLTDPKQIEIWKKLFPYRSLADRLTYEKSLGKIAPPRLTESTKNLLREIDAPRNRERAFSRSHGENQAHSLRLLHSGKIDEFTQQDQFGMRRLPLPGPAYMDVHNPEPVPFDKASPLSAEFHTGQSLPLPPDEEALPNANPWRLPARAKLIDFHVDSNFGFVPPYTLGDVQRVESVAGFLDHGFRYGLFPPTNEAVKWPGLQGGYYPPRNRWRVVRLELIGMLTHPTPVAYISDHLPRMDELVAAKTRLLTSFEAESLEKLQAGEDLFVHSTANLIDMVGSVRAAKKCVACHSVPYGTLLGAFSYQLQRDPPIKSPVTE